MEIKVNKHIEPTCLLYDADNNYVGTINSELELLDVRCQIKENQIPGYYLMYSSKINIDKNGNLSNAPDGFYDERIEYLAKLV